MKTTLVKRAVSAAVVSALALFGLTPTAGAAVVRLSAGLTASSTNGPYGAGNAGDGNQATYWESANNAFPQWIQADLGAAKSSVTVLFEPGENTRPAGPARSLNCDPLELPCTASLCVRCSQFEGRRSTTLLTLFAAPRSAWIHCGNALFELSQ